LSGNVLTTGTTNTVIEALWEDSEYLITYNLDGGTVSVNNPSKYTIETDDIILNNPTKVGYTFTGWTGSNGNTPSKNVSILKGSTGNKTYVANYDVNTYTISYELNGGIKGTNAPTSGTYGSVVTVSNPTKTGYTFERWSISGTGSSISGTNLTIGSENITEVFRIPSSVPVIIYDEEEEEFMPGTVGDILPSEIYGIDCSEIIIYTRYAKPLAVYVMNNRDKSGLQ